MFKVNNKDTRTTLNINFEYINAYGLLLHLQVWLTAFLFVFAMRKKCPHSGLFWSAFGLNTDQNNSEYRQFSRSV